MLKVPFSGYLKIFAHAGKIVANRSMGYMTTLSVAITENPWPSLWSKDLHYSTALEGMA